MKDDSSLLVLPRVLGEYPELLLGEESLSDMTFGISVGSDPLRPTNNNEAMAEMWQYQSFRNFLKPWAPDTLENATGGTLIQFLC